MAEPITFAALDGAEARVPHEELEALGGELKGKILEPGDPGFDAAIQLWNAMAARQPACVVQPASTSDVVAAVRFARDRNLLLTIKGGGHNIAGTAVADRALTLDMSRLRDVEVDRERRVARAGPGCLLRDVDAATQAHALAAVLGFVSETGAAGLTLGGGFGYLTRRYGWTVDNLEEVEVVLAEGSTVRAGREEHPELFWGLRGGGGNLGVVTEFVHRLHPVGPEITGGLIAWSADRTDEVLSLYRDLTAVAPRDLTLAATMRLAPPAPFVPEKWHGKPIVGMVVCHHGDPARAETDLAPLRGFGSPILDIVTRKPYVQQQAMLDATQPKGLCDYWKSEFLPGLPQGLLDAVAWRAGLIASPRSQVVLFHIGGALNQLPADEGAVGNRDAQYVCGIASAWPPGDGAAAECQKWVRSSWEAVRPFSTGGNYVNFQTADEDESRTRAAYGPNFSRLAAVKAQYDPHNFFRVNRNVTPAT